MESYQQAINIILASIAVYGIATLLADYSGAFNIFTKLREKGMPDCSVCLCVYIAVPFAILAGTNIIGYFAILGTSIILSRNL